MKDKEGKFWITLSMWIATTSLSMTFLRESQAPLAFGLYVLAVVTTMLLYGDE